MLVRLCPCTQYIIGRADCQTRCGSARLGGGWDTTFRTWERRRVPHQIKRRGQPMRLYGLCATYSHIGELVPYGQNADSIRRASAAKPACHTRAVSSPVEAVSRPEHPLPLCDVSNFAHECWNFWRAVDISPASRSGGVGASRLETEMSHSCFGTDWLYR